MFELTKAPARITSYNSRAENHGPKEKIPSADIHFEVTTPNDVLIHFGSQLRQSLYSKSEARKSEAPKDQGELDVATPVSDMPHLRNPALTPPFHLSFEGVGYTLTVDYGIAGSEIMLDACSVKDIKITPQEGGSVTMNLCVSRSDIQLKERGILSGLVKRETTISLAPPDAKQTKIPAAKDEGEWPFPKSSKP